MKSMASIYKIENSHFPIEVTVPSSKSYANRLLILGAISLESFEITGLTPSTDVTYMISALRQIGLEIEGSAEEGSVVIKNSFPACERTNDVIEVLSGDGGTTNRFLLALLSLGKREYRLVGGGRINDRPSMEFFSALGELGARINSNLEGYWCSVTGPIHSDVKMLEIDSSRSTQFATALKLVLAESSTEVKPLQIENSLDYWKMTLDIVDQFQSGRRSFEVPVDFSSLTYPLALGFYSGEISIANCGGVDALQADSRFVDFLRTAGASVSFSGGKLKLQNDKEKSCPLDVSIAACPDLTPTLAFVCALIKGRSIIRDVEVLRHKESDRVEEVLKVLEALKIKCQYDKVEDAIIIEGGWRPGSEAIDLNLPDDHRIIMMAYLFLNAIGKGSLDNATHVEKSFPRFFQVMSGN